MSQAPAKVAAPANDKTEDHGKEKKGFFLWAVLTSFFLLWVVLYMGFQVFAPSVVQQGDAYRGPDGVCERRPADNGKCMLAGLVADVVIMLILWLIVASMK